MSLTDQQSIITQVARGEDCEQIKSANTAEKRKRLCASVYRHCKCHQG